MSNETNNASGRTEAAITEDEAALYDRQIRLWGMEAQRKMRNASVLVVRLKGVATEMLKNIALAGVGRLTIVDGEAVTEEDLGAGFFFRDEDVGKNRVEVALPRIKALNPLVEVEAWPHSPSSDPAHFESLMKKVDMMCVTDWDKEGLIFFNGLAKQHCKLFYCSGSYGMLGYVFCDLGQYTYDYWKLQKDENEKTLAHRTENYPLLEQAVTHNWGSMNKRETKEVNPLALFSVLTLWKYESAHKKLPESVDAAGELAEIANGLIRAAEVNENVLKKVSQEEMSELATMANHEFSPVCAVVGGMLGQDMLKALSGREPPIANFFTFEGRTSQGTVCRMQMPVPS